MIIGIPGLGGHESSLSEYIALFPERNVRIVRLVNPEKSLQRILELASSQQEVIFLCNCYGLQLALRAADRMPRKVRGIIVIESFFAQFHSWTPLARAINAGLISIIAFFDSVGLARKRFWNGVDYAKLARYPIYVQPVFDMLWQDLGNYFLKIKDILTFTLPAEVTVPTLFILSPKGYLRNPTDRARVQKIFVNSRIVEVTSKSHNIVSLAAREIAGIIESWFETLHV